MKKFIAAALTAAFVCSAAPCALADAAAETAAVSGYVSTEALAGSVALVSADKTPVIHIDESDYAGVIRAAGDLVNDIEKVTDKKPTVKTDDITVPAPPGGSGISETEDGMAVTFDSPIDADADCYIAAYNADKSLAGVIKAVDGIVSDNVNIGYKFDKKLSKPSGGKLKAFVWKEQKPLTGVLGPVVTRTADLSGADVVIGTLGKSDTIDALAESGELDVSEIEGKWEAFTVQNVDDTVVIAGSDKRGTIYGIYDLSEKIGVSPWYFWADTVIGHADSLYVNLPEGGYTEGEPSVKYRGIFLNDEFNMSEWSKSMGDTGANMNNATYEKIFELLLRLKANYLWPAMHTYSTAFNNTEHNAELADEYGIVMGSSHAEPILRNNLGELYNFQQEWTAAHPDKKLYINEKDDAGRQVAWMWTDKDGGGNAVDNKEFISDYWRARAKANKDYENTYTLGMRGVHDGRFNTNMNQATAMNEIIEAQTKILTEEVAVGGKDISDVPQVFIPYKEILDLYNQGVKNTIPDYVTLMWTDDNFGYIRQLPTEDEAKRSGGAGIYYHLSYHGRPTSYLWLGTTQPGLIREEMTKAYDMDAREIWVANVGDLKPAETEIEYFLDLARDIDTVRNDDIADRLAENAKRDFGFDDAKAAEYADIKLGYYELANSRRPEHMVQGVWSLTEYGDEGQTVLDKYASLEKRAQALYDGLSEDKKPSLYELLLYPIKGAHSMAEKYVYADKAKYYADNGYGAAVNKYAALSDAADDNIDAATAVYTSMLGGKWDKMMNPRQRGLVGSFGGPITGKLNNPTVSTVPYTTMTIVPEGGADALTFSGVDPRAKFIDIINSGSGSFEWQAVSDVDWIKFNKTSGTVADNDRIYVGIDKEKVSGINQGNIIIERMINGTAADTYTIPVTVNITEAEQTDKAVYYEGDGVVSIEAEHFTNNVKNGVYEWKIENDFGRSGSSVKAYPNRAAKVTTPNKENSAYLEYEVYFTSSGTFPIDVYRMPTINELSGATLRCRIGVDDGTPVQFNGNTKTTDNSTGADAWGKGVLMNANVISGSIAVSEPGMHTIRLYNEDPGVVVDKFVIYTGEKKASYYGAPESYNTKYNSADAAMPEATAPAEEQTGDITALFSPEFLILGTAPYNKNLLGVQVIKATELTGDIYTFVLATYDENGNMIDATYVPHIMKNNETDVITVECPMPSTDGAADMQIMLIKGDVSVSRENNSYEAAAAAVNISLTDASLAASYDNGYIYPATRMNDYIGKESVCVVEDTEGAVKYIRQNTVGEDTYKQIPFNGEGKHTLKIKVSGEEGMITETFNTVVNIQPDTDPTSAELYNWDFSTDQTGTGTNVPVLGGNAVYDAANKAVKMTPTAAAGGSLAVDFDEPVTMCQGEKITVVTKIAYGKLTGKYTDYTISDSNGNKLLYSHITAYNSGSQLIQLGGSTVFEATSSLPDAIARDNDAIKAGFTTYTTTIDCSSGEITLVLSSAKGTETYMASLPEGTSYDIKNVTVSTNYDNAGRTCYVDDISVTKSKAAAYTITFKPVDANGSAVENAEVTIKDGLSGTVISPEADGTYKLCDGVYGYTVTSGAKTVNGSFELSPATESTTVAINIDGESISG